MSIEWEPGALPSWGFELDWALPVYPQFVISGNIRDLHQMRLSGKPVRRPTLDLLWEILSNRGCEFLLAYDPVDGLRVHEKSALATGRMLDTIDLNSEKIAPISKQQFAKLMGLMTTKDAKTKQAPVRGALVIDYASRLVLQPSSLQLEDHQFFAACEKNSHSARVLWDRTSESCPYNPIIWLVNRPADLPGWFTLGNESIRYIVAGLPDRGARDAFITDMLPHFPDNFPGSKQLSLERAKELASQFTLLTEGMTMRSLNAIIEIGRDTRFGLARITDAISAFKVGIPDDPWKQPLIRDQIRKGHEIITERVKGQTHAVKHALDVLTRSVIGLSGAQAARARGRPRGVLFLAGPTGVGKTELAKAITELLFGDETACHRFDMSEFKAEHSEARLIGAPPGYTGHDAGGELVNAVRQRPFSVLLFDEIEKANPLILDKFLQILEDGRLTDGRGVTAHFSESIIIFTSNLGFFVKEGDDVKPNISIEDNYEIVSRRVKDAIGKFFKEGIQRPELLNRIGEDNVIVFDFIRPDVAREIYEKMLRSVIARVLDENNFELGIDPEVREKLEGLCLGRLEDGGRGIGSRLESVFINPLARALFNRGAQAGRTVTASALIESNDGWEVSLT